MAVVLPVFEKKFRTEGEIIGRLVVGYGELEIDLCHCIAAAVNDLDMVFKEMFGRPSASRRIDTAVSIGRGIYVSRGLGNLFDEIICEMRHCLAIRNQFAHCHYFPDNNTGNLAFVNVEELARQKITAYQKVTIEDLASLTLNAKQLTQELLKEQENYFWQLRARFDFLNFEGRVRAGTLACNPFRPPEKVNPPPLRDARC
jgi:hypothetical protein